MEVAEEGSVKLEVHLGAVEEMVVAVLYLQRYMKLSPAPLVVVVVNVFVVQYVRR